jgi:hypothetical protein
VRRAVLIFTLFWVVVDGGTSWAQIKLYRAAIRGKVLDARGRSTVGSRAPEIQVTRWVIGEGIKHLSDLRNKMVVLPFSSAYNRAAQASNAALKKLHAALQARGRDDVVILALYDASAGADEVAAYAAAEGLRFPIGLVEATRNLGADSASFRAYGVRQLPTLFVIDREGIVRAVNPKPEDLTRLTGG